MKWFRRNKKKQASCLNCKFHTTALDEGYCAKDLPSHIDVRYLSVDGVRRSCEPLPEERICSDHQPAAHQTHF